MGLSILKHPKVTSKTSKIRACEDDALIVYDGSAVAGEAQCTAPPGPVLVKDGFQGFQKGYSCHCKKNAIAAAAATVVVLVQPLLLPPPLPPLLLPLMLDRCHLVAGPR